MKHQNELAKRHSLFFLWLSLIVCPTAFGQSGPIGHWKLDEGSGTTTADSSGSGSTGTLSNSPTWSTGRINSALTFSGNRYVTAGTPSNLANLYTTGMTVSVWINPASAGTGSGGRIVDKSNGGAGWSLKMNGASVVQFAASEFVTTDATRNSGSAITLNTWQHVAVTWTGSATATNINLYINGVLSNGTATNGAGALRDDTASPLALGNRPLDAARGFDGLLDDVRVYNRLLTATEIQALADSTVPSAPSSLSAGSPSSTQINLSWTASTDNVAVTRYLIERCTGAGCTTFAEVGTATGTTFNDTGLAAATPYRYQIRASDANTNKSAYSSIFDATTSGGGPGVGGAVNYWYDDLGRLKTVQYRNGAQITYLLDAAGNRISVTSTGPTAAPSVPLDVRATAVSSTQVNVTWSASSDNSGAGVAGYRIFRSGTQIATSAATSYSDTTTQGSTAYSYTVAAYDGVGNVSNQSAPASITTPDTIRPDPPTGLNASAVSSTQVNLTWAAASDTGGSGIAGYYIYRNGGQVGTTGSVSFSDVSTAGSTAYSYTVVTYDGAGNTSTPSNPASVTTPDTIKPTVPQGLLQMSSPAAVSISLAWSASTDSGGSGLAGYRVYRDGVDIGTTPTASLVDTNVVAYTSYTYRVSAYDGAGNVSDQSNPFTATASGTVPGVPGTPVPNNTTMTVVPWTQSWSTAMGPVAYYVLTRSTSATATTGNDYVVNAPTTQVSIGSAAQGIYYYFKVKACNSSNECSAYSPNARVMYCKNGLCP